LNSSVAPRLVLGFVTITGLLGEKMLVYKKKKKIQERSFKKKVHSFHTKMKKKMQGEEGGGREQVALPWTHTVV